MGDVCVEKSYRGGHIALRVTLEADGFGCDKIKMEGVVLLSAERARSVAQELIDLADDEAAKAPDRIALNERWKKWRDREIAAGRLKIMVFGERSDTQ